MEAVVGAAVQLLPFPIQENQVGFAMRCQTVIYHRYRSRAMHCRRLWTAVYVRVLSQILMGKLAQEMLGEDYKEKERK